MLGLNKVIIIGQVSERAELRYTPEGVAVVCFTVTICRPFAAPGGRALKEMDSFPVVAWRELAERCEDELQPGSDVHVEGRLRNHTWRDALGRQMSRAEIIAERIVMLDTDEPAETQGRYDYDYQWRE